MQQMVLPSYKDVARHLEETALKLHASQVHGLICGLLCSNQADDASWRKLITGDEATAGSQAILQALYEASAAKLSDFLFDFQLVIPDETAPLFERVEALVLWSQGFLTGLSKGKVPLVGRKPSDLTEAINDIIEIAKMDYEAVGAGEDSECDYVELVEYVRMAVIFIYTEAR